MNIVGEQGRHGHRPSHGPRLLSDLFQGCKEEYLAYPWPVGVHELQMR